MNKKLLVSVIFLFFTLSVGIVAKDNPKIVKQLAFAQTQPYSWGWEYYPRNYMTYEELPDENILIFHVPASPDSKAIFFETWSSADVKWTTWRTRSVHLGISLRIISPYIPNEIELELGMGCAFSVEKNEQGYIDYGYQRFPRSLKMIMSRDSIGWWRMYYRDTCQFVPAVIAIPILNDLINKGFDVEVNTGMKGEIFTKGNIQGAEYIRLFLMVEVTGVPGK